MKALAVTLEGLEDIVKLDIREVLDINSKVLYKSHVVFDFNKESELAEFIYRSRSIVRAFLLLKNFKFISIDDILNNIKELDFPYLDDSFVVRCERQGSHDFNSQDIERSIGEFIAEKFNIKADLNDAKTNIIVEIVDDHCFVGIDFSGIKLSKRDYRIKLLAQSINPVVAYSMIRLSDVSSKDSILDVFCKSGEIPIEAALFLKNIPNCHNIKDKLLFNKLFNIDFKDKISDKNFNITCMDSSQNSIRASEINSKLAMVNKSLKFSRLELEWLDTKFEKNSVDKIITFPPFPSNNFPDKLAEKIYKELFYQGEYVLKNDGLITVLCNKKELIEKYSSEYKFKKIKDVPLIMGNSNFSILVFKK